jgi:hypothetical protein
MKALAQILALLLISATIVAGTGTSAHAAAPIPFEVEGGVAFITHPCKGFTHGHIVWANRSASIDGEVHSPRQEPRCDEIIRSTTAFFEAYAGATKIDSTTRTVNYPGIRDFPGFSIGDPDLVGGINRIKIQVCDNLVIGGRVCGEPENHSRT